MSLKTEEKHFPVLITICFAMQFILGAVGQAFTQGSFLQALTWQVSGLFFISGTSLYAAKLHTDKWHIASAGFILLSIGQGIMFVTPDPGVTEEAQGLAASAFMAFLPGMLFICYYSGFPKWLRIWGVLSMIPFLIAMIKIDSKTYVAETDEWLIAAGFVSMNLVSLGWSYFVLRPYHHVAVQESE
ncbi:MAG: hypothetical protein R2794_06500 [Chitinophagales bacterium]